MPEVRHNGVRLWDDGYESYQGVKLWPKVKQYAGSAVKSMVDAAAPVAEVPATVASGMVGLGVGGLNAMMYESASAEQKQKLSDEKGIRYSGDVIDRTVENMTYRPRGEDSMNTMESAGKGMEWVGDQLLPIRTGYEKGMKAMGVPDQVAGGIWAAGAAGLALAPGAPVRAIGRAGEMAGEAANAFSRTAKAAKPQLRLTGPDIATPKARPGTGQSMPIAETQELFEVAAKHDPTMLGKAKASQRGTAVAPTNAMVNESGPLFYDAEVAGNAKAQQLIADLNLEVDIVDTGGQTGNIDPSKITVSKGKPRYGYEIMEALIDREGSEAAALKKLNEHGFNGVAELSDDAPFTLRDSVVSGKTDKLSGVAGGNLAAVSPKQRGSLGDTKPSKEVKNALVRTGTTGALGDFPTTTVGRIRNTTRDRGGYTVNMTTGETPGDGLMMGKYKNENSRTLVIEDGKITKGALEGFVLKNKAPLKNINDHLGTWINEGKVYIDVSRRFEPNQIRSATKFGEKTNQKAGWNIGLFQEFPVGNWQKFINSPEFHTRMQEMSKVGKDYLAQHPTDEWWDIHGTLLEDIYGKSNLNAVAGFIASTAPNTNPTMNMRMMSEYMRRHLLGEDVIQPDWRVPAGAEGRNEGTKIGMESGRKNNLVASSEGNLNALRRDKVNTEAKALMGDPDAVVLDRHWARVAEDPERGIFTGTKEGQIDSGEPYGQLEEVVQRIAGEFSQYPRNFSADVWTGVRETIKNTGKLYGQQHSASSIQGESKAYADIFDDLIKSKAEHVGITPDEMKNRLSRGDAELLGLILATPIGAYALSEMIGDPATSSMPGDGAVSRQTSPET